MQANIGGKQGRCNLLLRGVELAQEVLAGLLEEIGVASGSLVVEQAFHHDNFVDVPKASVHFVDSDELLSRKT